VKTVSVLNTLEGHSRGVLSVNFIPDGQTIVSGSYDRTVKVWDVNPGRVLNTFEGHSNGVTSVKFSHNGKTIVSGSNDNTVKV